jgi:hypothetical protein
VEAQHKSEQHHREKEQLGLPTPEKRWESMDPAVGCFGVPVHPIAHPEPPHPVIVG